MAITLNKAGVSFANSLISAGKVSKGSWDFSASDGNSMLGANGDDWANYGKHFLAIDTSASEGTKDRYRYPFAKGNTLYRSALTAIRSRASQQNASAIFDAAGTLLEKVDKGKADTGRMMIKSFDFEIKLDGGSDAGTFTGYGAVFSNTDRGGDVIMPGAFAKCIQNYRTKGKMPKMLWQHDMSQPIGVWKDMGEDAHGLKVDGKLSLGVQKAAEVHSLMKDGAIDGLSIGYRVVDFEYNTDSDIRTLKELDVLEISAVTIPMNPEAMVTGVKAAQRIETIRDFENFLRDEGGFSITQAKAIAARGYADFYDLRDAGEEKAADSLLDTLRKARAGFTA